MVFWSGEEMRLGFLTPRATPRWPTPAMHGTQTLQGSRGVPHVHRPESGLPDYGERYRCGERISTGFVESTVNKVVSKHSCKMQSMRWGKQGAHLLLQTRVKTPNGELGAVFQRWHPDRQLEEEPQAA
jgi:hypothetical protein